MYCEELTTVKIDDGITTIGSYEFSGCTKLTSISISGDITSLGYAAFAASSNLSRIYFDGTVARWNSISIDDTCFSHASTFECYVITKDGRAHLLDTETWTII